MATKKITKATENTAVENNENIEIAEVAPSAVVHIKTAKRVTTELTIIGDSPLIVHAWSEKARKMMRDAQMKVGDSKKSKAARDAKNPVQDFFDTMYWIGEKPDFDSRWDGTDPRHEAACIEAINATLRSGRGKLGFPATALKQAATMAVYRLGQIGKSTTAFKTGFFIAGTDTPEFLTIDAADGVDIPTVEMREDMVKIGGISKTADLRYRAMISDWKMKVRLTFIDTGMWALEDFVNAIEAAGLANGIGEWRNERNGMFGAFHVDIGTEE